MTQKLILQNIKSLSKGKVRLARTVLECGAIEKILAEKKKIWCGTVTQGWTPKVGNGNASNKFRKPLTTDPYGPAGNRSRSRKATSKASNVEIPDLCDMKRDGGGKNRNLRAVSWSWRRVHKENLFEPGRSSK